MVAFVHYNQSRFRPHKRVSPKTHTPDRHLHISGLRYYSPDLGRWVNKDPIGERGGVNVYGFVQNNPVLRGDYLGLKIRFIWAGPDVQDKYGKLIKGFREGLTTVKNALENMTDEQFEEARVLWNDILFDGSRTQFSELIEYELQSSYDEKMYESWDYEALNSDLESIFTSSEDLTRGNVTATTLDFFVGHGTSTHKTQLGEYWELSFTKLAKILQERATASKAPIAYVSCFRNSFDMSVSLDFEMWRARVDEPHTDHNRNDCLKIRVIPLGRSYDSSGMIDRWQVLTDDKDNPSNPDSGEDVSEETLINP